MKNMIQICDMLSLSFFVASISFKPMSNECGAIATEPKQIELNWAP